MTTPAGQGDDTPPQVVPNRRDKRRAKLYKTRVRSTFRRRSHESRRNNEI